MYKHLDDNKGKNQLCFNWKSSVGFWNMSVVGVEDRKHNSTFSHRWEVIKKKILMKKLSDN